ALFMVPAIVLFAGLSPAWVPLIFGAKWSALPVLLLAHAPAYLLASVFWGIMSSALVVSGKHRHMFVFLICFVAVYATLTVLATSRLGPLGVPLAASTTHILLYPFLFSMYRRSLGRVRFKKVAAELLRGAGFTVLVWWCAQYRGWVAAL